MKRTHWRFVRYASLAAAAVLCAASAAPVWLIWAGTVTVLAIAITMEDRPLAAFVAPGGGELVWSLMQLMAIGQQAAIATGVIGWTAFAGWLASG